MCCWSAQHSNLTLSPASEFANSLDDVWKVLPSKSRIVLDKHVITAHTVEWLRGTVYGWSDARREPLLHHVHFETFESHLNCSVFECVLYVNTLSDGLQLWRVGGQHCLGWEEVQVSYLVEVAGSDVTSAAPAGTYPPFTNGSKGDCLSCRSKHEQVERK